MPTLENNRGAGRKFDLSSVPSFLDENPTVLSWTAEGPDGFDKAADRVEEMILMTQGIKIDDGYSDLPKNVRRQLEQILRDVSAKADMKAVRKRARGTIGDTLANIERFLKTERATACKGRRRNRRKR